MNTFSLVLLAKNSDKIPPIRDEEILSHLGIDVLSFLDMQISSSTSSDHFYPWIFLAWHNRVCTILMPHQLN